MPLQNYSMQGLQDELYFSLFDRLAKVTHPPEALTVIDATFAELQRKYCIRDYDKKAMESVVQQLKRDYLQRI